MNRIDFSKCSLSNVLYSGADEKIGIIFANTNYMLKFAGRGNYGEWFKDVSEYISAEVFKSVGIEVQETILGTYNGRNVVACKDIFNGKKFKPFDELGDSSIEDKDRYSYSFKEICKLIDKSSKIVEKEKIKANFWKTYIIDALLANPDRHGKNWGFIYQNNKYDICPVFDNGASLFPKITTDEEYLEILNNEKEINERVYDRPISLIRNDEGIATYFEIISGKKFIDCNKALIELFPLININFIKKIIYSTDMPDNRKKLITKIVEQRYEKILKSTYEELIKNENN